MSDTSGFAVRACDDASACSECFGVSPNSAATWLDSLNVLAVSSVNTFSVISQPRKTCVCPFVNRFIGSLCGMPLQMLHTLTPGSKVSNS